MNKRPIILTILSLLDIVEGALGIIIMPLMFYYFKKGALPKWVSYLTPLSIIALFLIFALFLASGIGMWNGKKWGWWLSALYSASSVLHTICTNIITPEFSGDCWELLINALILLYLFKESVLEYFGLQQQSKLKAMAILLGVAIVITSGLIVAKLV